MPYLEQVQAGIRKFESLQTTFAPAGAADTEPDAVFQFLLKQALTGASVVVPKTVRGWELYSSVPEAEKAAIELHNCATTVVELIQNCPASELPYLADYLCEYCWRAPFALG
jgi:hypothetical protein